VKPEVDEVLTVKATQKKIANADLVEAIRHHKDRVLKIYDQVKHKRPVMLLDFRNKRIHAHPCEKYKSMLRPGSHAMLEEQYKRAIAKNKVLVLVWDDATRRLVTTVLRKGKTDPSGRA
jgi:hypothetical protein